MRSPSSPLAPLAALTLAAVLAGCSAFGGDDYGDLAPGTFRFTADGETYTGAALYDPSTELEFDQASVLLLAEGKTLIQITTDGLLTAENGDRLKPLVLASLSSSYQGRSGEVEILSVGADGIEGRFRFRLRETGPGAIRAGDVTADGAFRAVLAEE